VATLHLDAFGGVDVVVQALERRREPVNLVQVLFVRLKVAWNKLDKLGNLPRVPPPSGVPSRVISLSSACRDVSASGNSRQQADVPRIE